MKELVLVSWVACMMFSPWLFIAVGIALNSCAE